MNPNVDVVDILSVRELATAPLLSVTPEWWGQVCDPATGTNYKLTYEDIGDIISELIGTGVIEPDRVYIAGQPGPIDPATGDPVVVAIGASEIEDSYLDGKIFSLELRGVGFLNKGVEWDNDVSGGGWRLLNGTILNDSELYTVHFHPQISNIIAAPGAIGKFTDGIWPISANTAITAAMFRKLMILTNGWTVTLNATYPENVVHPFIHSGPSNKQGILNAPAGQTFYFNGSMVTALWLGRGEGVELLRSGNVWYILPGSTMPLGWGNIGHIVAGRLAGPNQIIAQGQTLLRADYPRLLDYLNRLNTFYPGAVVNAAQWNTNKTLWGFGDGATTIQVPDLRGYFPRWLDLGAGVDADRVSSGIQNKPGSPEGEQVKQHNHNTGDANRLLTVSGQGTATGYDPGSASEPDLRFSTIISAYGGTETRPINAAELPLIFV